MKITVRFAGKRRGVDVAEEDCKKRPCLKPHNCPVQGAGGVRYSDERWVCLTRFLHGCPNEYV